MHTRLFAVMATVGLVLFALGPGAATAAAQSAGNDALDVSVSQAGNAGPVVTVTDNDTAVENASVTVDALDNDTYEGAGENYTTDANGTVSLPEPEENVTVEVTATAGDRTGSTTAELTVSGESEPDSFGDRVSAFVQSLLSGDSDNIGRQIAEFVTANNPGNAPDHAGPPSGDDDRRGPPEHAGPNGDDADDNETDDDRRGPPEHAGPNGDDNERRGPPEDRDDDTETDDADADSDEETDDADADSDGDDEDDTDDEDADSDGDDDRRGPPEQARGNAGGR